jgi:tricorn protease
VVEPAPVARITDAFGSGARASADGKLVSFYRNRYDATRPAYSGEAAADVYTFDIAAKSFKRVTSDAHNDADAFVLPDGSVAFVSARSGQNNIWRVKAGSTDGDRSAVSQVTKFKPAAGEATIGHGVRDFNVSPGGAGGGWTGVFCVWDTMYTIDLKTAGAEPRVVGIVANPDAPNLDFSRVNLSRQVSDAALSPDGKTLAVVARGQVFVRSTEKDRPTRRVTNNSFRAREIAWSPDGRVLYFASDDSGVSGIYAATVALTREDLGAEDKPKAEEPKPAEDKPADPKEGARNEGKRDERPVFGESLDVALPPDQPAAQPEAKGGEDSKTEKKPEDRKKKPDWGKRWADSITFKVVKFAVNGEEQRTPVPSPDGKKLLVTRGRGDLVMFELEGPGADNAAVPTIKTERVLFTGWNEADAQWAPDSRHIVYAVEDVNYNSDIWLMDTGDGAAATAKPVNLTRHPDTDRSPRLSADGKVLYFLSERAGAAIGEDDVYALNLDKKLDGLRPYELAEYFKEAAEKAKKRRPLGAPAAPASPAGGRSGEEKPEGKAEEKKEEAEPKKDEPKKDEPKKDAKPEILTFDTDDAYLRVRRLTNGANVGGIQATPGGERVLYTTSTDGATQLVSVDYKNGEKKTVFGGGASNVTVSLNGEKVLFVSGGARPPGETPGDGPRPGGGGGEAYLGKPAGGESEKLAIDAPVTIDMAAQQRQKFLEAARIIGNGFYHPTLKDLDWPALTKRYVELASRTRTDQEFNRVFLNMLGELNGSHLGISGGRDNAGQGQPVGYLGIDVKPVPGGFSVTKVIDNGPADRKSSKLAVGDVIISVNGNPLADKPDQLPSTDFGAAMAGTSGQETLIEVKPVTNGGPKLMLITPQTAGADTVDRYRDEVLRNRKRVDELSGGKLGYLHIRAMDMASVRDFERDLFAAADGKLGLIIDVRDNGGGSTADILLSSLTAPRHAYTAARGVDPTKVAKDAYPRDRRLIYGYNRELTVLCNQNSFSNAEIFSHAIKTTKRGKLVGVPTFGAVISTGSATLIDGTTIRTPFRGWYLPDGKDMENNGAVPDIIVSVSPEDEVSGKDPQLEAAVKELLTRAREP